MRTLVTELKAGDRVNLKHDPVADPDGLMYSYHLCTAVVERVQVQACGVVVNFTGYSLGALVTFPHTYRVKRSLGDAMKHQLTVFEKHMLKIAKDTLRMPDAMVGVMGGPSKDEAREIVKQLTQEKK